MSDLSVWHPEGWIVGEWLVVRYRQLRARVARDVYPITSTFPTVFNTKEEAQEQCDALNRAESESRKPR